MTTLPKLIKSMKSNQIPAGFHLKKKIFFLDELILKCKTKLKKNKQNPRIAKTAKTTLKRKNGVEELTPSDFKIYYTTIVFKTLCY